MRTIFIRKIKKILKKFYKILKIFENFEQIMKKFVNMFSYFLFFSNKIPKCVYKTRQNLGGGRPPPLPPGSGPHACRTPKGGGQMPSCPPPLAAPLCTHNRQEQTKKRRDSATNNQHNPIIRIF